MTQINITLDAQVVEELKQLIIELADHGEIRSTTDEQYSVLDVIRNAAEKKADRKTWNRLVSSKPEIGAMCHNFRFPGQRGAGTPIANLETCIYIINLLPGAIGEKMRRMSAKVTAQAIEQVKQPEQPQLTVASPEIMAITNMAAEFMKRNDQQFALIMSLVERVIDKLDKLQTPALPPAQVPVPVQPAPIAVVKDSVENPAHKQLIDDVVDERVACGYSKMWVKHALANHSRSKHLTKSDWLYCAKKLGYKPGWGYYCFNETKHGAIKLVK